MRVCVRLSAVAVTIPITILLLLIFPSTGAARDSTELWGDTVQSDTTVSDSAVSDTVLEADDEPFIEMPEELAQVDDSLLRPKMYDPRIAVGLSAVVPGAGQWYCEKRFRGATVFLAEGIALGTTIGRSIEYRDFYDRQVELDRNQVDSLERDYRRFLESDTLEPDSSERAVRLQSLNFARLNLELNKYDRRYNRYMLQHAVSWTVGIYYFNLMDALRASNYLQDNNPRNPAVAGWLSAIPGLGLGQIYNGAYSKAGMITMTQFSLGLMAFNYQRLMNRATDERERFSEGRIFENLGQYESQWSSKYDEALRRRNMYLWYSFFFYFYGVFDAIVDAHLHDYHKKIRLNPRFDPESDAVGGEVSFEF